MLLDVSVFATSRSPTARSARLRAAPSEMRTACGAVPGVTANKSPPTTAKPRRRTCDTNSDWLHQLGNESQR